MRCDDPGPTDTGCALSQLFLPGPVKSSEHKADAPRGSCGDRPPSFKSGEIPRKTSEAAMNGLAMILAVIAVLLYGNVVTAQQGQLYVQYKVAPFQASGDVFCPVAGYGLQFSPWAEYFGGGCEGRQCRTAYGGQTMVLHYRCRPGLMGRFRGCRAQEDVSFPHCCLPACNDATYSDTFF